ncbi:acetyl-CoA carboxylase biotin carboxyl carrier protein [Polluticoccus soli]|uniref:acetyl-CoA carboxylase biotin carboxyl carrier protein n=1 Tax=Polluticoccus soli TaxID=3034150 RepID=UPI0023E29459|nr:acetyl-CoA carboxylase biotin carboxyl carrier protein [Flavipsychrobacter sp. JY13-12]
MEYKQIQELIKAINKSNISELSIEEGDFKITIKQAQSISETQFVAVQGPAMPAMQMAAPAAQHAALPAAQPAAPAAPTQPAAPANDKLLTIKSPMIGTFYRSPGPDKPSFVNVGDEVKQGQVICIVEAMKLFNEIESEFSGKIVKVLIDDASPVEYDQPLFLVEPA